MDEEFMHQLNGSLTDQRKVISYLDHFKEQEDGWKMCIQAYQSGEYKNNDSAKFFFIQILEFYIKTRYFSSSENDHLLLKEFLMSFFAKDIIPEATFILNKIAHLFSLILTVDYPCRWPSFFDDILSAAAVNGPINGVAINDSLNINRNDGGRSFRSPYHVELYLRVLCAFHSEVVDRDVLHSEQALKRNSAIKDTMRVSSVQKLVESWKDIITTYKFTHPQITNRCLACIGNFSQWIDLTLIYNPDFLTIFFELLRLDTTKAEICNCISALVTKGTDASAKISFVESIYAQLECVGIFNNVAEEKNEDYIIALAVMFNTFLEQFIQALLKIHKVESAEKWNLVFTLLRPKMAMAIKLFAIFINEAVSEMLPGITQYVVMLKQIFGVNNLTSEDQLIIRNLVGIVIEKMKYKEDFQIDSSGEEEAEFLEFRKELKVVLVNIGSLSCNLILDTMRLHVDAGMYVWREQTWVHTEVLLYAVYILGEISQISTLKSSINEGDKLMILYNMLQRILDSGCLETIHPILNCQFLEIAVRFDKYFVQNSRYLPTILKAFFDERGLGSNSSHLRSRSAYLFSRFIRSVSKVHLQPFLEDILIKMSELIKDQLQDFCSIEKKYDSDDNLCAHLTAEDLQFLFESASILVVQSQLLPEKKCELLVLLVEPLLFSFRNALQLLAVEKDCKKQASLAQILTQIMSFTSRTSKGFSGQQTVQVNNCTSIYLQSTYLFLTALQCPVEQQYLQQGIRQYLHRMIVVLDADVLQFIPVAMDHLLKKAEDARQLHDFIPFINQLVQKFKKGVVSYLTIVFMPITRSISAMLQRQSANPDPSAINDLVILRRDYFNFVLTLINNGVQEVLTNQVPSDLELVLSSIVEELMDSKDPQTLKYCFTILKKLIETWNAEGVEELTGFEEFIKKKVSVACFVAPTRPAFDLNDALTILALNEASACLKAIYDKQGESFLIFMNTELSANLSIEPSAMQEIGCNLMKPAKDFPVFFRNFIINARKQS